MEYQKRKVDGRSTFDLIDDESIKAFVSDALEQATAITMPFDIRYAARKAAVKSVNKMTFYELWEGFICPERPGINTMSIHGVEMVPYAAGAINTIGDAKPFCVDVTIYSCEADEKKLRAKAFDFLDSFYKESEIFGWAVNR